MTAGAFHGRGQVRGGTALMLSGTMTLERESDESLWGAAVVGGGREITSGLT